MTVISSKGDIRFWQEKVAETYFVHPLQEIIDELAARNRVLFNSEDDCRPASIGKLRLFDLLIEKDPFILERFDEKSIKACIFVAMERLGYHSQSRRKKCFWRDDV